MKTKWKFYVKWIVLGGDAIKTMWHEVSHELVQDLIYEHGHHFASPCIKRMMRYHEMFRTGNVLIKMEEMPDGSS
jgi:hypothetical protein